LHRRSLQHFRTGHEKDKEWDDGKQTFAAAIADGMAAIDECIDANFAIGNAHDSAMVPTKPTLPTLLTTLTVEEQSLIDAAPSVPATVQNGTASVRRRLLASATSSPTSSSSSLNSTRLQLVNLTAVQLAQLSACVYHRRPGESLFNAHLITFGQVSARDTLQVFH
jgi:hypothetical protein